MWSQVLGPATADRPYCRFKPAGEAGRLHRRNLQRQESAEMVPAHNHHILQANATKRSSNFRDYSGSGTLQVQQLSWSKQSSNSTGSLASGQSLRESLHHPRHQRQRGVRWRAAWGPAKCFQQSRGHCPHHGHNQQHKQVIIR